MRLMQWLSLGLVLAAMAAGQSATAQFNSIVFEEDFDSLTLGDSVNERLGFPLVTRLETDTDSAPLPGVFTATAPSGWTVDNALATYQGAPTVGNAGVPGTGDSAVGVAEFDGWTFLDKDFWSDAAGDQRRSEFTNASGTVAVVDPDEYFDEFAGPDDLGYFNSGLTTPSFSVAPGNFFNLTFDSSWRNESFDDGHPDALIEDLNNQAVEVLVAYDNGTVVTLDAWNSDPASGAFKPDEVEVEVSPGVFEDVPTNVTNEALAYTFGAAPGATSAQIQFNIANAGNDWWWALDNINVDNIITSASVLSEDFESLPLGDSVNERISLVPEKVTAVESDPDTTARPDSFTQTPPAGWNNDNSQVAGVGDPQVGVEEWEGWSFVTPDFWAFTEGGAREEFTKGTGVIAVADPDEWDDLEGDIGGGEINGPANIAPFDATLETPAIDITGVAEGELAIAFDATWREEGIQTAVLTADYADGNGPIEVLRWESAGGDPTFFTDDLLNESVLLRLDNPAGATEVTFAFRLFDAGNNFYWGIDNIQVGAIPEPATGGLLLIAVSALGVARRRG
ncbi:MAG: PEP-CTERM sorting domain-containing protein [Planctomycetota bacterium]